MMVLYSGTTCPFSQRCRFVLYEKGMDFEIKDIDLFNKPEDISVMNPYGTVPILVERDLILYESNIINEYIDEETKMPFANGIEQVEVAADATTFNTSVLKNVPEGYELCETGDVYFGDNDTLNVKVREKAEEKKTINVTYYYVDEKGENISCGTDSIKLLH